MSVITIPAPKIEVGDVIDGRTVRVVTGRKPRSVTVGGHGGTMHTRHPLPVAAFSGHVVCVGFEDDGPWKHLFGSKTVDVERAAALPKAA